MRNHLIIHGFLSAAITASAGSLTLDQFLVPNPTNAALAYKHYNGSVVVHDGFYLSSLLNGTNGGEISTDYLLNWGAGVGVGGGGSIGFTRSVNNNGLTAEALELYMSPDAARGAYAGLGGFSVNGAASMVVIDGFVSDPVASTANGSVSYAAHAVTWTQASGGGSLSFANPAAVPLGSTLRFSNGSTSGGDNQFGLLGFSFATAPTPVPGKASLRALDSVSVEVSWHSAVAQDYWLQSRAVLGSGAWSNASDRLKGAGGTLSVTRDMNAASSFYRVIPDDTGMVLGANVNESGTALDVPLLEQSRSEWMRTFFPIKRFLNGSRSLTDDSDLDAVREAAYSGRKLVLCLKLNFDDATYRVPAPGTTYEAQTFQWVEDLMAELDGLISVLETVNETFVDTHPDDLLPDTNGVIPMVRYLQRLVAHVHALGYTTPEGSPLPLYSGGFTRLYASGMQARPAVPILLDWIQNDSRVAGPNVHIHAGDFADFQDSFDFLRQSITSKPAIVTEFSMVWLYKANLEKAFKTWSTGNTFANLHGYDPNLIVRDYINLAITSGVSEVEWNEFLAAMPWYDTGFLGQASEVMQRNGTAIATFAFQQASSGGALLQPGDTPWILNPIFANLTTTNTLPSAPVNELFFQDYVGW